MFRREFLLLCALGLIATFAWGAEPVRVAEEENQAVNTRRAIEQLHIEYVGTFTKKDTEQRFRSDYWLDGKKMREDTIRPIDENGTPAPKPYREFMIITPDLQCTWSTVGSRPNNVAISYRKMNEGAPRFVGATALDPRLFGFFPTDSANLRRKTFESLLLTADRTSFAAKAVEFAGKPSRELTFERSNGLKYKVVLRDLGGWQPVFMEVSATTKGQSLSYNVEVREFSEPKPGRFFPKDIRYTRTDKGKMVEEEVGTIKVVSLDEPIDPDVFTLKGVGVPKGQVVGMLPRGAGIYVWNGEAIVRDTEREKPEAPQGAGTFPNWFDLGALAFAALVVCATYILVQRFVRASGSSRVVSNPAT